MFVKVCDALCGAGKTLSCINMMNNNTDEKFIFITPYLDEVERIKQSCAVRNFVEPVRNKDNHYSKLQDIPDLLRAGKNIASTHALFSCYTDEIKQLIKDQHYILVLDEVIDLFQPVGLDAEDVNFLLRNNIAKKQDDNVIWDDDMYQGTLFNEIMQMSNSKNLKDYDGSFFFWALPIDVFQCFSGAYVLTYMFEYQMLKYFFDVNGVEYELIGTKKTDGVYHFCPLSEMDRNANFTGATANPKFLLAKNVTLILKRLICSFPDFIFCEFCHEFCVYAFHFKARKDVCRTGAFARAGRPK